jgi:hypothetical protein
MLTRCLVLAVTLCCATRAAEADFKPIFNGHDLAGWDGDPRLWAVKAGAIRGETALPDRMTKGNTFLVWRGGAPKDFELKVKFRIQNGNSGIQYRSKEVSKWVLSGYQAEVENKQGKVGFLYHEKGRKYLANVGEVVVVGPDGQPRVTGSLGDKQRDFIAKGYYREKDWNEYVIIAKGSHLEHWLNGFKTIEVDDQDPKGRALEGLIALQIHAGPPMVVEFKDIFLKNL